MLFRSALGALNWGRKWYRPNGDWTGPQIAFALTQMLERSLSSAPIAGLIEDPTAAELQEPAEPAPLPKSRRRPA